MIAGMQPSALGAGVVAGGAVTVELVDTFEDESDGSSYSATVNFGAAASDRVIAVVAYCRTQNRGIDPSEIAGVVATLEGVAETDGNYSTFIFWRAVPTGTSGLVSLFSGSGNWRMAGFSVYRITGQSNDTPVETVLLSDGDAIASPTIDFTTPPSNGIALYGQISDRPGYGPGVWLSGITSDVDKELENEYVASASFGPGSVPDGTYQRQSNPGVDEWNVIAMIGSAWA